MFMVYMFDAIMVHLDNCRIFLHIVLIFQKKTLVAPESAFLIGGDTSLSTLRSGRFRPASEDRRRSYRSNRDRFKKSNNHKTLVMGPAFPMKSEDNPNKRET